MGPIRNPVFSNWHHVMESWNRGIFLTKKLHRVYQLRDFEFRYRNVQLTWLGSNGRSEHFEKA